MTAKLTLVSASAGYGKTTALGEWARQSGVLVAWVSLDKEDDEWVPFWSYVIASIQKRIPGFARTVNPLLEKGPSASSESQEPAISALLNELRQLSADLVVVLDDFHLIELPAIQKSLRYLLERLPPHVHLYIASRTDLDIPTASLLAKGEMRRITVQDLRFRPQEGLTFFWDTKGLSLSEQQAAELCERTEGWISGLQLAALALKSSSDIARSIWQFDGQQHHIANYLLEEVFSHLSDEMRAFLLRTSILSRMNHALCEAVTGQSNSQEYLQQLEQWNLFISPLDDRRDWYRYHQLLSDFLQRLFAQSAPEDWRLAHTRAAEWLESHGFEEDAARHYLEGRQYDGAVRVIENNLQAFLQKKFATLSRWILQLPEPFISKRPMVEMFYLLLLIGIRQWDKAYAKAEQAKRRYENLKGQMDETEWKQMMGNICFVCASASYFEKDLDRVSAYFELADRYTPEGGFLQAIGDNRYSGYEEFEDHLSFINDYRAAAAFLLKWTTRWAHQKGHPFAGRLYASYSMLLYEWNRMEEAERCIRHVLLPDEAQFNTRSLMQIYIGASRIQQTLGRPAEAAELLVRLEERIESPDYALFRRKIEAEKACLAVRQGALDAAAEWLERCGMASTDEVSMNGVSAYITLANVLAACGRTEEASALAERLQQLFRQEDRLRDRIRILILQSLIMQRTGRTKEALDLLTTALRLAEPQGFVRSFVDEGQAMAELLKSIEASPVPEADYAGQILRAFADADPLFRAAAR
ncbi:tetratricopeptide repeat protein [Cohnella hashimotonis]|uniref:Tetratricopeptide repeat protein n=1 Tax=Cohnella hashimotonis TaxID=2826895 RepID=A0ABT6TS24_9BACL|nr:tetratricopeptide repeat protein [Cohnella hashimotonis]MDI4649654.1 tetratricopeptide repeat protein [Cohnella hashimotonis]